MQALMAQGFEINVRMVTGSDDLRGGNNVYLILNFNEGAPSNEVCLGGGFGQNSEVTKIVKVSGSGNVNDIKSFTLRHDGSPRPDHPFDTYDNWDLQAIILTMEVEDKTIYSSYDDRRRNEFVRRFTGDLRSITLLRQP